MNRRDFIKTTGIGALGALAGVSAMDLFAQLDPSGASTRGRRPNILVHLADDLSWAHLGCAGDPAVKTPHIDRMAAEGVSFSNAFVSSATCTASRAAMLTGRNFWELDDGANLAGTMPGKFAVYTSLLARAGYHVGRVKKGYGPGTTAGWKEWEGNPAGPKVRSFGAFLRDKPKDKPFVFWYGSTDPHRPYRRGSGARAGIPLDKIKLPPYWPDAPQVRGDVADYMAEVQTFDAQLGGMIKVLEKVGELDNTVIVVLGDNGMPFPRCKVDLYDYGTRCPLIVRWPGMVKAGRQVDDLVSYIDLAPTFLEIAGLKPHPEMTGKSILPLLSAAGSGTLDAGRDAVFFGCEGLAGNGRLWPTRGIRTQKHLYIRNFDPKGSAVLRTTNNSPTRNYMNANRNDPKVSAFWHRAYDPRPSEELYDVSKDPFQLTNVVSKPAYAGVRAKLAARLRKRMKETGDPRLEGRQPSNT